MFRDVSKFYLFAWGCFVLGLLSLVLNVFGEIFDLAFILLFMAGFVLLGIKFIMNYIEFKKQLTFQKENLAVDMTLAGDGSYTPEKTRFSKSQLREFSQLKKEKLMPVLVVIFLFIFMSFFAFKLIANMLAG